MPNVHQHRSFTLIEILLVIGIIAVIAGIVILAVNPGKQLSTAQNAKRVSDSNQLEKALNQFIIDKGKLPDDETKFPSTAEDAVPICVLHPSNTSACIDASGLVTTYLAALPMDPQEPCTGVTGYAVYRDKFGPHVIQKRDTNTTTCPVSISWTDSSHGTIGNGQLTLSTDLDLQGKTLAVNGNGFLNLNGHKVLNGTVTNNGTIVAQGDEQLQNVNLGGTDAGAWTITGKSDGGTIDPTILAGKSITNLTIAPTVAGTVVKPTAALNVSGQLTVDSTGIFDTSGANSTFNGGVSNNGAIIIGDNAVHFNGGYDANSGQTVFTGTALPSTLTYHDLQIGSDATVTADATVNGSLTVMTGKTLTIASGRTLTTSGNVSIQGNLTGAGTLNLGDGGQSVTVSNGGSLSGQDATNVLTLRALQDWFLKYTGNNLAVSDLNLTHATNGSKPGTVGCTSCGGTGNQGITNCGAGTIWNGSACIAGNCMTDANCGGYLCLLASHTCTSSCTVTANCNANGYVCNGSSCVAGNCTSDSSCPGGFACVNNTCASSCSRQSDCKSEFTCNGARCVTSTSVCGNAIVEAGETCDDGNPSSGDGCSSQCRVESNWTCTTADCVMSNVACNGTTVSWCSMTIPVGNTPFSVLAYGTKIYVANLRDSSVSVIDTTTNPPSNIATVAVGATPVAMIGIGNHVYVANEDSNSVSVIDTTTNTVTSTLTNIPNASALAAIGTTLYVANGHFSRVIVLDSPPPPARDPGNKVTVINTTTNPPSVTDTISVNVSANTDSLATLGTNLYVTSMQTNTVSVVDTTSDTVTAVIGVGSNPKSPLILGTNLYVANEHSHSVSVIDTTSVPPAVTDTVNAGYMPWSIVSLGTKIYVTDSNLSVSVIDPDANNSVTSVNAGISAQNMTSMGSMLYVTDYGIGNAVTMIDTADNNNGTYLPIGGEPWALAALGGKIYVANSSTNQVTVIGGH